MPRSADNEDLEHRVLTAHHDYLAALVRAEMTERVADDFAGRLTALRALRDQHLRLLDLLEELGYIPKGLATLKEVEAEHSSQRAGRGS